MNRKLTTLLVALMLLLTAALPTTILGRAPAKPFAKDGIFIVQLAELPVVAYDGSIQGYAKTKPAAGSKIDPTAAAVVSYAGLLKTRHDAALQRVGGGSKLYDYAYSYNGFAAKLTAEQANRLAADPSVLAVSPNELREVDTSTTPSFLGLDATGGLWSQLGGHESAGDGIIIGVVDSGIWPQSLSFTDRVDAAGVPNAKGTKVYTNPQGWHGTCESAEIVIDGSWDANLCNRKLIGAQHFNASWGGDAGVQAQRPWEFLSPRDYNGHGTHTTSTAGGNWGVPTTGPAAGFGAINGMAPHARVAMYKALWSTQDAATASGFTADLVAAIDTAVADGVDVMNYSISGTTTNFLDPVEVSFLFAADAGIFVAQSAGNSGPATGTVAHPSPWTTTVAAGTHNRNGTGSVTLGNGVTYYGASLAAATGPAPLIDSTAAGLSGADATKVALCYAAVDNAGVPVLDPAKVAGKIVVCDRGITGRTNKSLAVKEAGGIGMILVNTSINSLNADFHFVPTVHLQSTDRAAVKAYAATVGATATINQATVTTTDTAPFTASFSSRGPLAAGGGDLLKPDVIAPGQDILAAVAPPGNHGLDFNLYSGTSMSSPHVAGVAALLKDLHPGWTPAMIKSALMTSAYDVLDAVATDVKIFRQGAGHIKPNSAANPGLVFDNGFNDWLAFLCGTTTGVNPASCTYLATHGYSLDPSDFNGASIAIGGLAGIQTVHRKVTSVGGATENYTFSYSGLAGITVAPSASSITVAPGATQPFDVTFTTNGAPLNTYVGGFITWTGNLGHLVRIPVVIKPVALAAPAEVSGIGANITYSVTFGYNGPFAADPRGLVPATVTPGVVPQDPDQTFSPTDPTGTIAVPVTIAAGTSYARFQLFNADVDPGSDIDLYVYLGSTQVGSSAGGTSDEVVNLLLPAAGNYTVYVHGWGVANGVSTPFTLYHWLLGTAAAGNMTVTEPATAVVGTTGTVTLSFTGLAAGTKYLGSVVYSGVAGMPNPTIVRVDTAP
jgi:subtilisin family serine protease